MQRKKRLVFKMFGKNKRLKLIQKSKKDTIAMGNGSILFHNLVSLPSSKLGSFSHVAGANKGKKL